MNPSHSRIEAALAAIAEGKPVVVADHPGRENEGDLIVAAEKMTPEVMAFIVRHTSGLVCVGMPRERLDQLRIPLMVPDNTESQRTAFTVSVDWKLGVTTGISAADRSATVRALADPAATAEGFARPGHVFPLRCDPEGVLVRPGHTEAASDLARMAGLAPVGALCEIVNDDGAMARGEQIERFAQEHHLPFITIHELVAYRRSHERLVTRVASARLPTAHGLFLAHVYRSRLDGAEHIALVKGEVSGKENILVRVHSECFTGDVLGSLRCDCGSQLERALEFIATEGKGVVVYLRNQEGRGIGLTAKVRAYALQDEGLDTVQANLRLGLPVDARSYDVGAQILTDLGLTTIRLMSNNPAKFSELTDYRLKIVERVPLLSSPTGENRQYLRAKQNKLGHLLGLTEAGETAPPGLS